MTKRITYDVSPRGSEWTVTKRGASRPTAVCDRKDDAIARAREVAKGFKESQVVVRKADGTIQSEWTYGTDPFPPRG
jgi:hypothetical protein